MSPQFVDFDADGRKDIVAGTYDGSPYVALGGEKGWAAPEGILDRHGRRIVQNAFWNYETKAWDSTTRCNPEGDASEDAHGTSAWAVDWDGDGDLDLLLGDYKGGRLVLRRNGGSGRNPAFAARNEPVMAGGKPLVVEGGVSTLRIHDWNGDGKGDLLLGSMGDCFQDDAGGGVVVLVNTGTAAVPAFDRPVTLVERSRKGHQAAVRPDSGLYMDVADFEGDGDLDLVVGGYSHWDPPARELDLGESARAAELKSELAAQQRKLDAFHERAAAAGEGLAESEARAKIEEWMTRNSADRIALQDGIKKTRAELGALVPAKSRISYVWLYENKAR